MALFGDVPIVILISNHNARFFCRFNGRATTARFFLFRRLPGWHRPAGIVGGRSRCCCAVAVVDAELCVAFDIADVPDSDR